ncbi:hypothetical protein [Streptomyces sp. NPDC091879]|jgi:hypothetical protein|uniref:hypothetical protein n=1 Tax=Streptomyces sp. NPDC091879 TaxID=3366006 RepID=UPI003821D5B8
MSEQWFEPQEHDLAYDTVRQCVAEVVEIGLTYVTLRKPQGGGKEWERSKSQIRRPTVSEKLSPRVAALNGESANRPVGP